MNNGAWYSNIARLVTIFFAVCLYGVALLAFVKRKKKRTSLPSAASEHPKVSYTGPERRVYPRASLNVVVRYKVSGIKGIMHVFKEGRIKDISEGGLLLVEAQDKLEVDNPIELKFRLPTLDHFILLRGSIVWAREVEAGKWYDYGIQISHIEPNDRKNIAKYVITQQVNKE